MRVIKFKAKSLENGKWVYGSLVKVDNYCAIHQLDETTKTFYNFKQIQVDPNTVCQYTGENDIKGVEIYEGDLKKDKHGRFWTVRYKLGMFEMLCNDYCWDFVHSFRSTGFEVIGNIHDKDNES